MNYTSMKNPIQLMNPIQFVTHLPGPLSLWRSVLSSGMMLGILCLALSPTARAQDLCREGCDFSLGNTFLGTQALVGNTTGSGNTASGFLALSSNTSGGSNTATGNDALASNITG